MRIYLVLFLVAVILIAGCTGRNNESQVEELQDVPEKINEPVNDTPIEVTKEMPKVEAVQTYSRKIMQSDKLTLSGNDIMEIDGTHYVTRNSISLSDNAKLIIRNSKIEHQYDYTFQYELSVKGNATITFENSTLVTACNGSFNWNFRDTAALYADNIKMPGCNTWNFFSAGAKANIKNWARFGGTFCDNSDGVLSNSNDMEVELCYPNGASFDMSFPDPKHVSDFTFPSQGAKNVNSKVRIVNSSIDGWGLNIGPGSDITIRNAAATVGIHAGLPWKQVTVELENLVRDKYYEDTKWQFHDAKLRLVNTTIYGWEANAYADRNTLIVRNSNITSTSISSDHAKLVFENTIMDLARAQEDVEITIRNSEIMGDVIAADNSKITLINTVVHGNKIEKDNGEIIVS